MTDAQIIHFAVRLSTGQLEPAEMAKLSVNDCRKLLYHLNERREWLLQQYVSSVFASRTEQAQDKGSRKHIYLEEQILTEINARAE